MVANPNEPKYVMIDFHSLKNWQTAGKATALLQLLRSAGPEYVPERMEVTTDSLLKYLFAPNFFPSVAETWANSRVAPGLFAYAGRRSSPRSWLAAESRHREEMWFNSLALGLDERRLRNPDNVVILLDLARRLCQWAEAAHGCIYHWEELENRNWMPDGQIGGQQLHKCLPGIYWANYFGPLYVEWFGRERFVSCPAYDKEEFPDGTWLLLSAASPLDWDQPETVAMEQAIQRHLEGRWSFVRGAAFFDPGNPRRRYRTPHFEFEQPSRGAGSLVMWDPGSFVFEEDPTEFLEAAPALAQGMRQHLRKDPTRLDYSPESLRLLDDYILRRSKREPEPQLTEEGILLLRRLTAYYGEVVRRNLGGRWVVAGPHQPGVLLGPPGEEVVEYVFAPILKLWLDRERDRSLTVQYHLLSSGEWARVVRFVEDLSRGRGPARFR